jgi:hypothetical protein
MPADLVDHLVTVTTAAIRNEAPALSHDPSTIRGVTIEATVGGDGLADVLVYVERRTAAGALLSRHSGVR